MKGIKVSDELYTAAQTEASLMSRSIAQQVEHWAGLGRLLEETNVSLEQVRRMLSGDPRVREKVLRATGALAGPSSSG